MCVYICFCYDTYVLYNDILTQLVQPQRSHHNTSDHLQHMKLCMTWCAIELPKSLDNDRHFLSEVIRKQQL